MSLKSFASGGRGKKSTDPASSSSSSSSQPMSSTRSESPNIPGAYHDNPTRTDQDDSNNKRNHASPSQQSNVPINTNRTDQHWGVGSEAGHTGRGGTSSLYPNTRAHSAAMNNQTGAPTSNGRGQNDNRYAPLSGWDFSLFSTNLVISARPESNDNSRGPPLLYSETYRNNARPDASGRSSDQSRPFPAAGVVSTPGSRRKAHFRRMANDTIAALKAGSYDVQGKNVIIGDSVHDSIAQTQFYGPDTPRLVQWLTGGPVDTNASVETKTQVSVLNISTLAGARLLENVYHHVPGAGTGSTSNLAKCFTGVLNFASATKPGGGFQNGAEAQEESLARASTLFASLSSSEQAQMFYSLHAEENRENLLAYYSHGIIYSPRVLVLRDDEDGTWFERPFAVDVLSCAAVNAGEVRRSAGGGSRPNRVANAHLEVDIEKEMTERMARILCVFESHGVRNLVLGTFGTGVFQNKVDVVARIWAHLLIRPEARFKDVFDRVIFAITGEDTFVEFQNAFAAWGKVRAAGHGKTSVQPPRGPPRTGHLINILD